MLIILFIRKKGIIGKATKEKIINSTSKVIKLPTEDLTEPDLRNIYNFLYLFLYMERGGGKLLHLIGLIIFLYLFILSIVLIKNSFFEIGKDILNIAGDSVGVWNAFGIGWLIALIMQSSGAATSALMALYATGVLGSVAFVYMILGTRIGGTLTALFIALLIHAKRRDFRHGFEIGLANLVYAVPIAVLMFILEYFFGLFSGIENLLVNLNVPFQLNFIDAITVPVVEMFSYLPQVILLGIGIFLLIASLREMPHYLVDLWGEENLKKKINKYMGNKGGAFLIGFLVTAILFSTGITIGLLIPFVVSRFINLKKVIPYIIGASLGGVIDVVLSALIIGEKAFPALVVYVLFSLIGLLWLFNTDLLFRVTKFISKRTLHVSKLKAFLFILLLIVLAVVLVVI